MQSKGVIYVATGSKFVDEALISIRSVNKYMPGLSVTLFTDVSDLVESPPDGVDSVILLTEVSNSCRDKIKPLSDSPYEKTLFLDTDTYLCEPVFDLFDMLDRFDIGLAQAPDRYQYELPELPGCFTEFNSGVIAFKNNHRVRDVLALWEETFVRMLDKDVGSYRDQHSLRDALYRSRVRVFVLPPEYNFRTICPNFAGKHCAVKIIHGRHSDLEKVASRLNSSQEARVFLTSPYRMITSDIGSYESFLAATMNTIFQSLPTGMKSWLSNFRARFSS